MTTPAEHAATEAALNHLRAYAGKGQGPDSFTGMILTVCALAERASKLERERDAALRRAAVVWAQVTRSDEDSLVAVAHAEARAERLETALRLFSNGLHTPPDEPGEESDGITVHAWAPGYPMGCPICTALDAALGETAPPVRPADDPHSMVARALLPPKGKGQA